MMLLFLLNKIFQRTVRITKARIFASLTHQFFTVSSSDVTSTLFCLYLSMTMYLILYAYFILSTIGLTAYLATGPANSKTCRTFI